MKWNATQFGQRVVTALLFGTALLVPLFAGKITGLIILGLLSLLTTLEYLQLQGLKSWRLWIATFLSLLMYIALTVLVLSKGLGDPILYATYLALAFCAVLLYRLYKRQDPFVFTFQVLPATLYIAIPIALLFAVANWGDNYQPVWVLAILLFVWINDVLAYLIGRKYGKKPFSRFISPNKTWEGTLAGWFGCILMALILNQYLGMMTRWEWICLGLIIGVTSSIGDLIESLFKRRKGIKDSGTFLPGHGGLLDRIDSLLFSMPFIALFFSFYL
ncbi:MAG: phosphatidate cytidylyltransferase [Saprospiraceae bacterium]|nr:phosphatidate cytidylyltransferase [Saprospiraceae bacterium]